MVDVEAYLGEIRLFAYARAPTGWLPCDGRLLQISQYQALYSLLFIQYGGDGRTTFALPDLRGQAPVCVSPASPVIGSSGGSETVTLQIAQTPPHTHNFNVVKETGTLTAPVGNYFASAGSPASGQPAPNAYGPLGTSPLALAPDSIASAGGSQPHDNMQPYVVLNFCICVQGIYPQRSG